ncbi:hypothetical protein Tco_1317510 [Tanacetum coccineum]
MSSPLNHLPKSIPPEIEEVEFDPEGDILFLESLLYDNSSPRPPEALQANSNAIESLPPSQYPVADKDFLWRRLMFLLDGRSIHQERISHKRTKNQSKRDKIGHGMEKCVETKPNQSKVYSEKKKAKKNILEGSKMPNPKLYYLYKPAGAEQMHWEYFIYEERKGEIKNDKRKDVEGPFLYTIQTFP